MEAEDLFGSRASVTDLEREPDDRSSVMQEPATEELEPWLK